jgi:hypothetical protein
MYIPHVRPSATTITRHTAPCRRSDQPLCALCSLRASIGFQAPRGGGLRSRLAAASWSEPRLAAPGPLPPPPPPQLPLPPQPPRARLAASHSAYCPCEARRLPLRILPLHRRLPGSLLTRPLGLNRFAYIAAIVRARTSSYAIHQMMRWRLLLLQLLAVGTASLARATLVLLGPALAPPPPPPRTAAAAPAAAQSYYPGPVRRPRAPAPGRTRACAGRLSPRSRSPCPRGVGRVRARRGCRPSAAHSRTARP